MYHALYFPVCTFRLLFRYFPFRFNQPHLKADASNQMNHLCFHKTWTISHLYIQAAMAEDEGQCNLLSNILHYIYYISKLLSTQ